MENVMKLLLIFLQTDMQKKMFLFVCVLTKINIYFEEIFIILSFHNLIKNHAIKFVKKKKI